MKSATVLTREIDDLNASADELVSGIKSKIELGKKAVGIVYCDADVEVDKLGALLHERLGCDIMGLTTTASIERHGGYCDMGIVLTVITGDDVDFAVGSTGDLGNDTYPEAIKGAYAAARGKLADDPKLIVICAPYIADLTSENYNEILDEVSGHVPVFGGVATDHYDLQHQKTFFNGDAYARGLVFLLISGNVRPVFAMEHRFGGKVERKGLITKSSGNNVERVGDQTFKEFLSDMTLVPDDDFVIFHFQSTPFVMELPDYEDDEQPVVRALCTIDHTKGSGGFLSKMPEGSRLSISVLQRDNLSDSCAAAMDQVMDKMKGNPDYEYSLMLITTCNARHLLMADTKDMESRIIKDKLADCGPGLNAMGFYGFGEMCPTAVRG
ncbi:FIST C-terminal domain-containing protein, partial [Desulfovibrio sp. OttesenSCG-928-M14]|nr:FIST C-terminal domain-containing protein [Desulfovibrio sp. OttesenSCG-928-M14]